MTHFFTIPKCIKFYTDVRPFRNSTRQFNFVHFQHTKLFILKKYWMVIFIWFCQKIGFMICFLFCLESSCLRWWQFCNLFAKISFSVFVFFCCSTFECFFKLVSNAHFMIALKCICMLSLWFLLLQKYSFLSVLHIDIRN